MLITHEREKLINAIIFFANHTKHLDKIKLFKLLYLLDFEHFRQTGQNVTGLTYSAQQYGPVPAALAQEWDKPKPDLAAAIATQPKQVIDYKRQGNFPFESAMASIGSVPFKLGLVPIVGACLGGVGLYCWRKPKFDDNHFSKRELRIMAELANKYRKAYSPKIDVTHAENGAWAKVWNNGKGSDHPIPYDLAIPDDDPHQEAILEAAKEYQAIVNSAWC